MSWKEDKVLEWKKYSLCFEFYTQEIPPHLMVGHLLELYGLDESAVLEHCSNEYESDCGLSQDFGIYWLDVKREILRYTIDSIILDP